MDTIISVQDIRVSLGDIARRAESGESFTVVRNSKPSFRIVPAGVSTAQVREAPQTYSARKPKTAPSLTEIRNALTGPAGKGALSAKEIEELIAEVRRKPGAKKE